MLRGTQTVHLQSYKLTYCTEITRLFSAMKLTIIGKPFCSVLMEEKGTCNHTIILRREVELCIMCVVYRVAGITTTPANGGFLKV